LPGSSRQFHPTIEDDVWLTLQPVHQRMALDGYRTRFENPDARMPIFCFTPGYSPKAIAAFEEAIWGDAKFRVGGRWTSTASGPAPLGGPLTLTYSFIPDGTSLIDGATTHQSALFDLMETQCGYARADWQNHFHSVFDRWEELTGITYVFQATDDGAEFPNSSGALGVRGDLRIGAHSIDGQTGGNILAYNYFPENGDMVLDKDNIDLYSDRTNNSRLLRNVISHEHGHGMGLNHTCPINQTKLMEPTISSAYDGPQDDDIQGAQSNYGDRLESDDSAVLATSLGTLAGTQTFADLCIDRSADEDWFSFAASASGTLSVTLTPVGSSYLEGEQNGDGSCSAGSQVNSAARNNLFVEVRNADGTSLVATANSSTIGVAETLTDLALTGPATYNIRVRSGAEDTVQRYTIAATFIPGGVLTTDLSVTKTDNLANAEPGDTITYTITAANVGNPANGARLVDDVPSLLTNVSWTAIYSGGASGTGNGTGDIDLTIPTLPSGGGVAITVSGLIPTGSAGGTLRNDVTIFPPFNRADSNTTNNTATDQTLISSALPNDSEEFNAFTGMAGTTTSSVNDTGTGFSRSAAFASTGFLVDTVRSQNGRGLEFSGAESANIFNTTELSGGGGYDERSHMVAFWFRTGPLSEYANGTYTPLFTAQNKSGSGIAYTILIGRHTDGSVAMRLLGPVNGGFQFFTLINPFTAETWHRLVLMYTSASDSSGTPASQADLRVFLNPASGTASPFITWSAVINSLTSNQGDGPLGRYRFGRVTNSASVGINGGKAFIDSVGTWDGFGTAGQNDLSAAITYLSDAINTAPSIIDSGNDVTVSIGGAASSAQVAVITDNADPRSSLITSVDGDFTGLEVTTNTFNAISGNYNFGVRALCSAVAGSRTFTLSATDTRGLQSTSTFLVNVGANPIPTIGTYTALTLTQGASGNRSPSAAPADSNGTVQSVILSPTNLPGGGTASIVPATGAITVQTTEATTPGPVALTVTVTDNCGATAQSTLNLTVGAAADPTQTVTLDSTSVASGSTVTLPTAKVGSATITRTFTVQNSGGLTLQISNFAVPVGVTVTNPLLTQIPPSGSDTFTLTIPTTAPVTVDGAVSWATNIPGDPGYSFTLEGKVEAFGDLILVP
jgi:uncharacterized repeat protein (TIGR01451 family)